MSIESGTHSHRYTGQCLHCARTVFRDARRVGDLQLTMIESHILICRPLATPERASDLIEHCKITERTT
jgi:hypothetical protein